MPIQSGQKISRYCQLICVIAVMVASGCQSPLGEGEKFERSLFERTPTFAELTNEAEHQREMQLANRSDEDRLALLSGKTTLVSLNNATQIDSNRVQSNDFASASGVSTNFFDEKSTTPIVVRSQSPDYGSGFGYGGQTQNSSGSSTRSSVQQAVAEIPEGEENKVKQVAYQFPELATPERTVVPGNGLPSPNVGGPNELNPLVQPFERGGNAPFPMNYADLDIYVTETQTGRINFGGAYNSDNGIVGQFIVNETNFDITRWPRNFREITDGTAWRGAGQTFRLELVPGANLERYLVNFSEPYLFGTDYSFSMSAYLFTRQYFDWDEKRVGGRFAIGRRLTPDLSINAGLRLESVELDNPRVDTSQRLNDQLGTSNLFLYNVGLVRDTRDNQFQATEGSYLSLGYSQAFGDFSFARGDVDYRRYKLLYERPDGSGRHTLSFGTKLGFSGKSTPIFENYFAGGFSTLRGFDFRGVAPIDGGVRVGGAFQWLNSVEYMFPITADDMLKGVLFCDFGTIEESVELNSENFRVAPGFGFRVRMPGAGMGAPLAFDFAFPVATAQGDDEKVFSFYLGVLR